MFASTYVWSYFHFLSHLRLTCFFLACVNNNFRAVYLEHLLRMYIVCLCVSHIESVWKLRKSEDYEGREEETCLLGGP